MSTQGGSYAPKSPDLSSFYSGATDIPASANAPGGYPFQPTLGAGVGLAAGPGVAQTQAPAVARASLRYGQPQPRHQYTSAPYQPPTPSSLPPLAQPVGTAPTSPAPAAAYSNIGLDDSGNSHAAFNTYPPPRNVRNQQPPQPEAQYYSPRQQTQFAYTDRPPLSLQDPGLASYHPPYSEPASAAPFHPTPQAQPAQFLPAQPPVFYDQSQLADPPNTMPPRKIAPAARQSELGASPVKTKFPTARIKRIMQADEEVGKVAQQTPIAVGKALELFMVQLVRKSADVAREKNSKRITAQMLKHAVDSTNEWDFLQDIVAKVTEEKEGGRGAGKGRADTDSDEEADGGEVKKKGRGGRKKKAPA
ncbi:hypothetical protein GGS23DRAFT_10119 [Durotheca rogersii]|uniref:uncharacterized protein n=1 Tax=Durotheca rogersii TaxID=419775 RepID=UPI002220E134|nr:uncharacterized protein GGS23DRAFT_10119 [Durotheca rogersii]KAI5868073.1 hypothetical protein GGS23DRAFT_10119 [Durotheca rogersii]